MAKELPYFKFEPAEWLAGRIAMESFETQGAYINLCSVYWQKLGQIEIEDASLRVGENIYAYLLKRKYIFEDDDFISIGWLDSQLQEREAVRLMRSEQGKKGARAKQKLSKSQAKAKQDVSRIEEKRKEENNNTRVFSFKDALIEQGADPQLAADWMVVRKTGKASNTKTALNGFMNQVKKSGLTIDQVLEICCERSWKGFNADWDYEKPKQKYGIDKATGYPIIDGVIQYPKH